jgi:Protein of unknown function (DUF3073)
MGRGRAKAKQTKVARELKYSSGGTDLDALRKELAGGSPIPAGSLPSDLEDDETDEDEDDLGGSYGASSSR